MVWQRTTPVSASMRVQQDKRKLPFRCCSAGVGAERQAMPSTISTRHSLHLPCLRQEVGTLMPSASAHSNRDAPRPSGLDLPLKCKEMLIYTDFLALVSGHSHFNPLIAKPTTFFSRHGQNII